MASTVSSTAQKSGTAAADSGFMFIDHLTKRFDEVAAVDDVTLAIQKGEIFALLGASGCGKSTLLRMLAGFETPTTGKIYLEGTEISRLAPYDRPINMMFQSYALFPHLTVTENVAFGLRRDGMPKGEIDARVDAMLTLVQLKPFARRKPHQLSGGQQQRVALARSLAKRPKMLLLDEPLGALDKKLREQTQIELVNIIKKVGVTCVMVTHDQEEAMTMADRVAVMRDGLFLQVGAPHEVYETPATRYVADFIGNVNLFKGVVEVDEPDHVIIGSPECRHYVSHGITGTLGMEVSVALRPEKICLSRTPPQAAEREQAAEVDHNIVRGVISSMAYFGSYTTYHLELESGTTVKATLSNAARHEELSLTKGDTVYAWWDGSDVVVLTQ
ncbi:MAG: polyamine ABC transporter ATP-binding protein [Betaproteobacteria bacterium]|nr:polyamine ABC transporter ATP-binding protein [Betaproteobacteria bacterium]